MREKDAIKYATMHIDGEAHEWWQHGMTTLGHASIISYTEFTRRLIETFDRKDPEIDFRELTQLQQTGNLESYVAKFQRLAVMVNDLSMN